MEIPEFYKSLRTERLLMYKRHLVKSCQFCKGQSYIITHDNKYLDCPECLGKFQKIRKYIEANIIGEYIDLTLEEVEYEVNTKKKLTELLSVIEDCFGKYNFLFHKSESYPSYGVTTAGILVVKRMIDLKYDSYVIEFTDLVDCFFNFADDKKTNQERTQKLEWLRKIPVLLIDNLGQGLIKKDDKEGFVYTKLSNFFLTRKINSTMTIICSDISNQKILEEYKSTLTDIFKTHYLPIEILGNPKDKKPRASDKFAKEFPRLKSLVTQPEQKKVIIEQKKQDDQLKKKSDDTIDGVSR